MTCVVCAAAVATNTAAERELFRSTGVCSFQCVGRLKLTAAVTSPRTIEDTEVEMIHAALARHAGNKKRAAADLGICLKTLYNKMAKHAIPHTPAPKED